jgi:ATP-dependent Clp protease ATP-binding subunit ClpA
VPGAETAIVEGIAQRVADNDVPDMLRDDPPARHKRVMEEAGHRGVMRASHRCAWLEVIRDG